MSDSKRECATCQFFQTAHLSGNGWCTHPKRQVASDLKILVREKEIACRNTWGDDLWANRVSSNATTPPAVVAPRKGLVSAYLRIDDEVTSIVDSTVRTSHGSTHAAGATETDDVVTHTSVRQDVGPHRPSQSTPRVDDHNAAAIADQDERVRHMARGSRDAIFHARERVALRRLPTRPTIEPDPGVGDEPLRPALDQRRSDRLAQGQATEPAGNNPGSPNFTPPVPRSEVEARGVNVSPAAGVDVRFESVPDVNPEVHLPRLREFLRPDHSSGLRGRGFEGSAPTPSAYELVLKRALEIKASDAAEYEHRAESHHREQSPSTRPRLDLPPDPDAGRTPGPGHANVVWDVEGERLNFAFDRARVAIGLSPNITNDGDEHLPGIDDFAPGNAWPPEDETSPPDDPDLTHDTFDFDFETWSELPSDAGDVDEESEWSPNDEVSDTGLRTSPKRIAPYESPRGSWFRSLNFGIRRRYQSNSRRHLTANSGESTEWIDDYDYPEDDVDAFDNCGLDSAWEDQGEPQYFDGAEPELVSATSEESWLEDASQFPDSQPASWHEARAQLLANQAMPANTADGVTASFGEDSPPLERHDFERNTPVENTASPIRPEPLFFAIDEPGGMDAFRSALFGDQHGGAAQSDPTSSEERERHTPSNAPPRDRTIRWVEAERGMEVQSAPSRWFRQHPPASSGLYRDQEAFESGFDIRDAITDPVDDPVQVFDVASRVRRACRTCRSFRPSESGIQGWCMQHDAPTYRQMVESDVLTCQSSIGDWWLAADSIWIPPIDTIQPETPRTDRLVARSDSLNEPGSGDERRVRTRTFG